MGVDIQAYRCRIGTFAGHLGRDVILLQQSLAFTRGFKTIGTVIFIGILLLMAGIEVNPGPNEKDEVKTNHADGLDEVSGRFASKPELDEVKTNHTDVTDGIRGRSASIPELDEVKTNHTDVTDGVRGRSASIPELDEVKTNHTDITDGVRGRSASIPELDEVKTNHTDVTDGVGGRSASIPELDEVKTNHTDITDGVRGRSASIPELDEVKTNHTDITDGVRGRSASIPELDEVKTNHTDVTDGVRGRSASKPELDEVKTNHTDITDGVRGRSASIPELDEVKTNHTDVTDGVRGRSASIPELDEVKTNHTDVTDGVRGRSASIPELDEVKTNHTDVTDGVRGRSASIPELDEVKTNHTDVTDGVRGRSASKPELDSRLDAMLAKCKMTQWFRKKISLPVASRIKSSLPKDSNMKHEERPWALLEHLMCLNSKARDKFASSTLQKKKNFNLDWLDDDGKNVDPDSEVCSLDILILLVHCSNPILRAILYQKMYLCKIAVPFLYAENENSPKILLKWPLRSINIENSSLEGRETNKRTDISALDFKSHLVIAARVGRPFYSKSKLLNNILSEQMFATFFNKDSPSGCYKRLLSRGYVEAFWLPLHKESKYSNPITFLNARGDLVQDFILDDVMLLSKLSDLLILIIDTVGISTNYEFLNNIIPHFARFLIVFCNNESPNTETKIMLKNLSIHKKVTIIPTHKNNRELNEFEMKETVTDILLFLKNTRPVSFDERLKNIDCDAIESKCIIDENTAELCISKARAENVYRDLEKESPLVWKEVFTPIQFELTPKLAKLLKACARERDSEETKKEIKEMKAAVQLKVNEFIKKFTKMLIALDDSSSNLIAQLTIFWLGYFIDKKMGNILPEYLDKKNQAWKLLSQSRRDHKLKTQERQRQFDFISASQQTERISFGVQHIFREIYHIYDNLIQSRINPCNLGLPSLDRITKLITSLFIEGFPLEIMSGDYCFVAKDWMTRIFGDIDKKIENKKVFVISILGLQSSGKSTLLNAMFGTHFSVSAGRCTRGVHVRLFELLKTKQMPFEYVLVVDTEGLRAAELSNDSFDHDNEMATFATGIGDMALLNIMGESTSEINNILQIVVHAFLRLKNANRNINMNQNCVFLHQNVSATDATNKMSDGFQKLLNTLDNITKEAASSEGYLNIRAFGEVIEMDATNSVWYFPNLWQGTPPVAGVSSSYSLKAMELKYHLLEKNRISKRTSCKTMLDMSIKIRDLFSGILAENFVFSFKNSLEIKAHLSLEMSVKALQRNYEKQFTDSLRLSFYGKFSKCDTRERITDEELRTKQEVLVKLSACKAQALKDLQSIFEKSDYPEIIENWKSSRERALREFFGALEKNILHDVERIKRKREIVVEASKFYEENEKELNVKSKKLVKRIREGEKCDVEREFERMWKVFVRKLPGETKHTPIKPLFFEAVWETFPNNNQLFKNYIENWSEIVEYSPLSISISDFKLTCDDISVYKISTAMKIWGAILETIGVRATDIEKAKNEIKILFMSLEDKIKVLMKRDCEIQIYQIKELLQDILNWKTSMDSKKEELLFVYRPSGIVKIVVHVGKYLVMAFQKHNDDYQHKHGLEAELQKLKVVSKLKLYALIKSRKEEITCAQIISERIYNFILDYVNETKVHEILGALRTEIPQIKHTLIVDILVSLMLEDDFDNFMYYIKQPYNFAKRWVSKRADKMLFESGQYYEITSRIIRERIHNFIDSLEDIDICLNIESWVQNYTDCIEKRGTALPTEVVTFLQRNLREIKIDQIKSFTTNLKECYATVQVKLNDHFHSKSPETVEWVSFNPTERMIDEVWGCKEACVFCFEPCYKSKAHEEPDNHSCIQHRPQCCRGTRDKYSQLCTLECCNTLVASKRQHNCVCFDYLCNESKKSCFEGWHPYSDYSKFVKNWTIEHSNDPEMVSKYWMRFVAKYRKNLKIWHDYKIDNIPQSWEDVSEEDAIDSIKMIYKI